MANGSFYLNGTSYLQSNPALASAYADAAAASAAAAAASAASINTSGLAPLASPALTGTPTAPTATVGTNNTQLATTAFVLANAGSGASPSGVAPPMDGTAAAGTSLLYARQDHVHPTDTSRAPVASPAFTGVPSGPTAAPATNNTQLATTAYVDAAAALSAPLAAPTFTGIPRAPTATVGTNTTQLATTAFVLANGGGIAATVAPLIDGTAAVGVGTKYAREDHVHPTDITRSMVYDYDTVATIVLTTVSATPNFLRTAGYYAVGDKGGALYKRSAGPAGAGKFQSADGAWWEIAEKLGYARQFGAKGDGTTDDVTAINNCLSKYLVCHLDEGTFCITSGPINLTRDFAGIHGVSVAATKIYCNNSTYNAIQNTIGLTRITVKDLWIDRVVSGTPSGAGVSLSLRGSMMRIERVKSTNHINSFILGATDDSLIFDCEASNSFGNGFVFTNDASYSTCQWSVDRCLAQYNAGVGYIISPQTNGDVSIGTMIDCNGFANTGGGFSAVGTSARKIQGIRMLRCFLGGDGGDTVYLDTYGTDHHIENCSFELSGQAGATGRNAGTAQSNLGNGVTVTANNTVVTIANCSIGSMSRHCIQTGSPLSIISNCYLFAAGLNGVANASGIITTAGTLIATGNVCMNNMWGIFLSVDAANILGGRMFNNTSGTITGNGAGSTVTAVRLT